MKRIVLSLALFAPNAFGAADLILTQQGELSSAAATREYAQTIGTDTAESGSTASVINATAHASRVGDILRFTDAGSNFMVEARVQSTTTNTITLYRSLPAVPSVGANFTIMRLTTPAVSSSGAVSIGGSITASNPSVSTTGSSVPASATFVGGKGVDGFLHGLSTDNSGALNVNSGGSSGKTPIFLVRNSYTGTPVTTAAYVELVASTSAEVNDLLLFDSSGSLLVIAEGAAGLEVDVAYVFPGGSSAGIPIHIASGTRISIKAIDVNATTGQLAITGLQ